MRTTAIQFVAVIAVAVTGCARDPAQATAEYIESGDRYVAAGRDADAVIEYRNAVKLSPESPAARWKLAEAAVRVNDPATYVRETLQVADLAPDDPAAQARAASVLLLAGEYDAAKARAEAALQSDGAHITARVVLGQALTRLGQSDAGERALIEAVRLAPNDAGARVALASLYWSAGRLEDAEHNLRRAVELSPESAVAHQAIALLYMATSRVTEAEPHWRQVARSEDGAPFALADFYIAQGRLDEGERELKGRGERLETRAAALLRLAVIRHARGALDDALQTLDEAQTAGAPIGPVASLRGSILAAKLDDDEAVKAFDTALKTDPTDASAALGIAAVRTRQGHAADAVEWTERAYRASPHSPTVRAAFIGALARAGQLTRAVIEAKRAVSDWPESAAAETQLAALLAMTGERHDAHQALARALTIDPNHVPAMRALVALDLAEGKRSDAERRVQTLERTQPVAPHLILAAETYAALGKVDNAEAVLHRLIAADDTNLAAYALLGRLYLAHQRVEPALVQFRHLADRDPTPASRTIVAQLLESQGRRDEAKREYAEVLARHSSAPVAANNLAWMHQADGDLDEGLRLALIARARLGRAPEVSHTLGWIYYRRAQFREAIPVLADTVAARPNIAAYRAHLGLAYWKGGDPERAREELRVALASQDRFVARDEAEAAAAQLEAERKASTPRP